ncbi:MAG: hypothetical protein P9M03_00205, partial [Candidatus Theseobacter exili]|nr:hypothetical protein [Candidatus Theseobacter exili]
LSLPKGCDVSEKVKQTSEKNGISMSSFSIDTEDITSDIFSDRYFPVLGAGVAVLDRLEKNIPGFIQESSIEWSNNFKKLLPAISMCIIGSLLLCYVKITQLGELKTLLKKVKIQIVSESRLRMKGYANYKNLNNIKKVVDRRIRGFGTGFSRVSTLSNILDSVVVSVNKKSTKVDSFKLSGKKLELSGWSSNLNNVRSFVKKLSEEKTIRQAKILNVFQNRAENRMNFIIEAEVI